MAETYKSAYTGAQIDRAIGKALTEIDANAEDIEELNGDIEELNTTKADKTQLSNRNLLDNAWFTIDQRQGYINKAPCDYYSDSACTIKFSAQIQFTIKCTPVGNGNYTFTNDAGVYYVKGADVIRGYVGTGYTVDRWKWSGGTSLTVASNGLEIPPTYFWQNIENYNELVGKTATFSIMLSDGTIYSGTNIIKNNESISFFNNDLLGLKIDNLNDILIMPYTTISVRAVKLEVGSISTLHLDAPPNYAEELLKCQRYGVSLLCQYGVGIRDANTTWVKFSLPTNIRPSMSLKNFTSLILATTNGAIHIGENQITDIGVFGNKDGNEIYLTISDVSLTQFTPIVAFNFCAFIDAEIY